MSSLTIRPVLSVLVGALAVLVTAQAWAEPRNVDRKAFFDSVKAHYHSSKGMTQKQVDSYGGILEYWEAHPEMADPRWVAYVLATAKHETRMEPVREGFCETDQCSRNAVAKLYKQRRIKRNYAAPDRTTGHSYYGRGFVQLTWADNYKKMGKLLGRGDELYRNPDLVLDPDIATKILWVGMIQGAYRPPHNLKKYFNSGGSDWAMARNIINGDADKLGKQIGGYGKFYATSLKFVDAPPAAAPRAELDSLDGVEPLPELPVMRPKPRPPASAPAGTAPTASALASQADKLSASGSMSPNLKKQLSGASEQLRQLSEQLDALLTEPSSVPK